MRHSIFYIQNTGATTCHILTFLSWSLSAAFVQPPTLSALEVPQVKLSCNLSLTWLNGCNIYFKSKCVYALSAHKNAQNAGMTSNINSFGHFDKFLECVGLKVSLLLPHWEYIVTDLETICIQHTGPKSQLSH